MVTSKTGTSIRNRMCAGHSSMVVAKETKIDLQLNMPVTISASDQVYRYVSLLN